MPIPDTTPAPLRILVTGAGGLIGAAVSQALAGRGHAVTGLIRATAAPAGVETLAGDVAEPGLGLDPALRHRFDLVIHCAAVTGFRLPDATYRRVNVGGTANVLEFARATRLLHVGTAYVCGDVANDLGGVPVAETPATGTAFNNGYEAGKAAAEALVWQAHRAGLAVAVARPSIVVGRWADGATATFGTIYQLIRLLTEGRVRTLPVAADASLDLVPLDHVVAGLVDIAERMDQAAGRVFHLASGTPVPITALAAAATAFPQFQIPAFVDPARFDAGGLAPRARWLYAQVVQAYTAYLRPSPRFATAALPALSGRTCPPIDAAFLGRLLAFAVASGFLPDRFNVHPGNADRAPAAAPAPN